MQRCYFAYDMRLQHCLAAAVLLEELSQYSRGPVLLAAVVGILSLPSHFPAPSFLHCGIASFSKGRAPAPF